MLVSYVNRSTGNTLFTFIWGCEDDFFLVEERVSKKDFHQGPSSSVYAVFLSTFVVNIMDRRHKYSLMLLVISSSKSCYRFFTTHRYLLAPPSPAFRRSPPPVPHQHPSLPKGESALTPYDSESALSLSLQQEI